MTPNWFAIFSILAWPIIAVALFKSKSVGEATLWTILGAFLLLPARASIKIEMIPAIDKVPLPNVCALIGCLLAAERSQRRSSLHGVVWLLITMFLLSPVITSVLI